MCAQIFQYETGSNSSAYGAPAVKILDPNIWIHLPDHILYHILSFLPFWSVLQLLGVSRNWRKYLKSNKFLVNWSKNSPLEVLFFMLADGWSLQPTAAYCPSLNKWLLVPLSGFSCNKEASHNFHLVTAAGGLLCMEEVEWPNRSLVVFNPLNKSYRKLPPMLDMRSPYIVGMTVNTDKSGYKILVAQDGQSLVSQHYDSISNSWKMNTIFYTKIAMLVGMASIKEFLFCLSFWPLGLIAYNNEEASWCDMQVKMPPSVTSPHLIHNNGELFLVGGLEKCCQLTSIKIWKVDLYLKECIEFEEMPDCLFSSFSETLHEEHFSCMGEAGVICFHGSLTLSMVVYDMNRNRWWWVPPCPMKSAQPYCLSNPRYSFFNSLGLAIKPCFIVNA
ncbi:hypothetical protein KP509_29G047100 [Ceratopteris richardii]|uniref:F-box domain-containing protein n=1 Tax=Ceratopteris richardii TaxID=49495 RepID=A0A8T2R7M4_CERRI|nr:hypothetical protein KP509_29G047100 [Ceratopteris richardii]